VSDLERDQVILHLGFLALAVPGLLVSAGPSVGWRLALLAALYHVATLVVAAQGRHRAWLRVWWFIAVLGVLLTGSVSVLAWGLESVFLDDGGFWSMGGLPGFVPLLWAVPLTATVAVADAVGRRRGERASWLVAGSVGALLLAGLEVVLAATGAAVPRDVLVVGAWAPYLLPAGILLGTAALAGTRWTRDGRLLLALPVAAVVALAHAGAAAIGWVVVERALGL
jgi:hypothetical protein